MCKEPFYPSGRTCYLLSPEKMKFEDAEKFCSSAGASFVEPSSSEKMDEVKKFLKSRDEQGRIEKCSMGLFTPYLTPSASSHTFVAAQVLVSMLYVHNLNVIRLKTYLHI